MHSKFLLGSLLCSFFGSALLGGCATEEDLGERSTKSDSGARSSGFDDSRQTSDGGTNAVSPVCVGDPLPCKDTSDETTCTKRGCSYAPTTCTGTALSCSTLSQTTCDYVPGCRWTLLFGNYTCAGQAVACDERALTGNCDAVLGKSGCRVEGGCSGTPKPCSEGKVPSCAPGCGGR